MNPQTRRNLVQAMRGEAFAYLKYTLFAKQARENGREALAVLYEKTADTERLEHFVEEAELAWLVGSDEENLRNAIRSENNEIDKMYREFADQALAVGEDDAAARFAEVGQDEMGHRDAFIAALEKLEAELAVPAGK